jgi:exopolysaccharide biosynthesis protein
MKIIYLFFVLLILTTSVYAQNKNPFDSVDKTAIKWKLLLNSQEVDFLPDIHISGKDKYLPIDILKSLGGEVILDKENKSAYITNNDESFFIKEGSKNIYVNNKAFLIHQVPIWKNNTLYISIQFMTRFGVLVSENNFNNELNVIKAFNKITDIENFSDNTENKIIFNFTKLPVYNYENKENYYKVNFFGSIPEDFQKFRYQLNNIKQFKKIDIDTKIQGITSITFYYDTNVQILNSFILENPYRFVIQIPKLYKYDEIKNYDEIIHTKTYIGDFQGPISINTLQVNPYKYNIRPFLVRDENNFFSLKETSKVSKDYNAIASINGGYFSSKTKFPLGIFYENGKLLSQPLFNRSALFIDKNNNFSIKNIDLNIYIRLFYDEKSFKLYKINSFNLPPFKNQSVLFSFDYGKDNLKKDLGENFDTYIISSKGEVLKKINDFEAVLKENDFFLYVSGQQKENLDKLLKGVKSYELFFDFSENIDNYSYILGAGPTLIKDSKVNVTDKEEQFKPDITEGKSPRTALGLLKNDDILFIVVDGRIKNSRGFTLEELANYLIQYEIKSAINLDGGGSSTMYFNSNILNEISDSKERKVSTIIMVLPKK